MVTDADAVLCGVVLCSVLPQAVGDVNMSPTDARATLTAAVIPPTVHERSIQTIVGTVVATAPHGRTTVVVAFAWSWPRSNVVSKLTP